MREFALLQRIYAGNAGLPGRITIPPGDDMGAVRLAGGELLVTVDQVAAGVHFDARATSVAKIARKAITRNLSDVAAMAASPVGAVVAACLPRDFGAPRADELADHLRRVGLAYDCPVFGGDVSVWDHPLLLSVTVLAEPDGVEPVLRRGTAVGDAIFVSGTLGGSLEDVGGYIHHLDFEPRLALARRLASDPRTRPTSMIDLSDGLARDLGHLCAAAAGGGVAARLWAERLPISRGAVAAARRDSRPPWEHALGDGEDYELLFTLPDNRAAALPAELEGVPLTRVGEIVAASLDASESATITLLHADGREEPVASLGWEHAGR